MNKKLLKSLLIPMSFITTSDVLHSKTIDEGFQFIKNYSNMKKIELSNVIDEMLQHLNILFKKSHNNLPEDSFMMEKHGELIITIWFYKNTEYFVHIYDSKSSHKGSNLFQICLDLITTTKGYNVGRCREYFPDGFLYLVKENLSIDMNFAYSSSQPDSSLLELLIGQEKTRLLINRGYPKYGNTFGECEEGFFIDYPELKKYSFPIIESFEMSLFEFRDND